VKVIPAKADEMDGLIPIQGKKVDFIPLRKGYALCSRGNQKEISPSKGGLSLDPPQSNSAGSKSHLLKAQEKAMLDIHKGKQASITRALRVGNALKNPTL
jgi:hypothetical protein